jgi:inner membrane protein
MDPITQGALGGAAAQALFYRRVSPAITWAGILGGMAPDLDIFIRSQADPLLFMVYHRSFTHSLSFIPFGGALVGLLLWLLLGRRHSLRDLVLAAIAGFATHGLLDACTTYGTLLYWPFSHQRVSWDVISIIDPIYTAILIIGVVCASAWRRGRPAIIA